MNNVKKGIITGIIGTICNLTLATGKLIVGILSGSISIQSDAINNLGDVISSVAISISFVVSNKKASKKHPFGYGRFEYIMSFVITIIIVVVAIEFVLSSIKRILNPQSITFSWLFFIIIAMGIIIKIGMAIYYHTVYTKLQSSTIKAARVDSIQDVLISSATLISLVASKLTTIPLDGIIGLAISAIILIGGLKLINDTIRKILGHNISKMLSAKIMAQIMNQKGVLGAHDLLIHDYGQNNLHGSVHIELSADLSLNAAHRISDNIEKDILDTFNIELVVHPDPVDINDSQSKQYRKLIRTKLFDINPSLSFHDFQLDKKLQTISVDIVIPYDLNIDEKKLIAELTTIDFNGFSFDYIIDYQ